MATKLNGKLNLSKIPKNLIFTDKNGDKCVYIDVIANKNGADQYGNTHSASIYDKEAKKAVYVANLKAQEFGVPTQAAQAPAAQVANPSDDPANDLPF